MQADEQRLTLYAPVNHVRHRGDTLNSALLTTECRSPAEGVIGVRTTHHAGSVRHGQEFALPGASDGAGKVSRHGDVVELSSGELTLRVDVSRPWQLEFTAAGKVLTSVGERGTGFVVDAEGRHYMLGQLSLGVGELVHGLGERFTPFVKNGQTVDIWQADGGTSSEQAYKDIPFYLTNRGYGVFVNHTGRVSYQVGSEAVGQVQFSVEDQSLEYFVVYGPTPKEILVRYTALTGRSALPPAWALGLWLTTSFTTDYDEATVNRFIGGMTERGIRSASSTSTASGCAATSGATSPGTPTPSPTRRACWPGSRTRDCESAPINDAIVAPYFTRHSGRTPTPPTPSTSVLTAQSCPGGEPHPAGIRSTAGAVGRLAACPARQPPYGSGLRDLSAQPFDRRR